MRSGLVWLLALEARHGPDLEIPHAHTLKGKGRGGLVLSRAVWRLIVVALAAVAASACGGDSSVAVTRATADPTYSCPGNAINTQYDLHATAVVHNPTASTVTITGVTAQMKLEAVKGPWLEKVGDVYDAGAATFAPAAASARSDTKLNVTFHSACTSPAYGTSTSSYGDYQVTLRIKTSAGSYSISAANLHRILTA